MTLAFTAIFSVELSSISASSRAKQVNIVAILANNLLVDSEYLMEGKAFNELKTKDAGVFERPFEKYRWTREIKTIKFPSLTGNANSGTQIMSQLSGAVTTYISEALREVALSVIWTAGKTEQTYSLSTYWVDLSHAINFLNN